MRKVIFVVALICFTFYFLRPSKPKDMGLLGKIDCHPGNEHWGVGVVRRIVPCQMHHVQRPCPKAGGFSSKPVGENDERVNKAVEVAKQEVGSMMQLRDHVDASYPTLFYPKPC